MPDDPAVERQSLVEALRGSRRGEFFAIFASGLAGVLSLAVSTYNVYLTRAQVRAQVWPHLEWLYGTPPEGFTWSVHSTGVGPAKILGARLSMGDHVFVNWQEVQAFVAKGHPRLVADVTFSKSTLVGRVLPSGGVIDAGRFRLTDSADMDTLRPELIEALKDLDAEICYCSTLDDCWVTGRGPVASCPMDRLTFEQ